MTSITLVLNDSYIENPKSHNLFFQTLIRCTTCAEFSARCRQSACEADRLKLEAGQKEHLKNVQQYRLIQSRHLDYLESSSMVFHFWLLTSEACNYYAGHISWKNTPQRVFQDWRVLWESLQLSLQWDFLCRTCVLPFFLEAYYCFSFFWSLTCRGLNMLSETEGSNILKWLGWCQLSFYLILPLFS